MALVLLMRPGESIFAGDDQITLREVVSEFQAVVEAGGSLFDIVDDRATEVLPSVRLSIGDKALQSAVRIAIQAPRDKLILRKEKYREMKDQSP